MKRFFFSQSMLDSMADAGKIRVEKGVLTMLAGGNPAFDLLPAYRFVRTIDNGPDPADLVGQIRSERELREMGAEVYMDSVIFRDVAYQADPGFIADRQATGGTAGAPAQQPAGPAASVPPAADKALDDGDLSRYLLDDLLK
jgi:hypothetical protein